MSRVRILTVEDDAPTATLIYRYLDDLGYDCVGIVASGEEAVIATREAQPDLILMDIMLSGTMDGIAAAKEIESRYDIPIVFLTAHADHNTVGRAKLSKTHGYIVKPFEEKSLRAGVELALYRHAIEGELVRQHQWLDATLNGIDDCIMIADAAGSLVYINQAAAECTGLSPEAAEGQPLNDIIEFIYRNGGEQVINPVAEAFLSATEKKSLKHYIMKTAGGTLEHVEMASMALRVNNGMLLGVALIFRLMRTDLPGELEERVREVYGTVFNNIQSLGGAVAICAWCKKIKDSSGKWIPADPFLLRYAGRWITHGICPECEEKVLLGETILES